MRTATSQSPRHHSRPRATLLAATAGLLALAALALATGLALAAGSLSITPGILERTANPGTVGALKIANTTSGPLNIRLALRPWLQSRSGEVSPNRARTLPEARPSPSAFTLPAGASRTVSVALTRRPANRSLYGAIEVTGQPTHHARNGITLAYRVVTSLRLDPPRGAASYRAEAGVLVEQGSARQGTLLIAVRNTGNTIAPIAASARIDGQGRSLRVNGTAKTIVPGQIVNVPLAQLLGSLPKGRYAVAVTLTQAGRTLGTFNRAIGLR